MTGRVAEKYPDIGFDDLIMGKNEAVDHMSKLQWETGQVAVCDLGGSFVPFHGIPRRFMEVRQSICSH